jgi:hypothetical protein
VDGDRVILEELGDKYLIGILCKIDDTKYFIMNPKTQLYLSETMARSVTEKLSDEIHGVMI